MDVSIIIVNYNTLKITNDCIESVFKKTKNLSYEIILVDNASTDGSREFFTQDSRIKYVFNETNIGFGRANNVGINIAKGRNIIFLNSDTLLCNNAIQILSTYLDSHPDVAGGGGNLYQQDLSPAYSYGYLFPSLMYEFNFLFFYIPSKLWYGKNQNHNFTGKAMYVPHISGANLMIKKEVLEKVGLYNDAFFMYREETELCFRIIKSGYKLVNLPNAKIIHLEGKSCPIDKQLRKAKWMYDSRKTFLCLYHNTLYVQVADILNRLGIYSRIILHSFYRKEYKNYWTTVLKYI